MARVDIFSFTNAISKESVSEADDKEVKVDAKADLPPQVKEDTDSVCPDEPLDVKVTDTPTIEPGPEDGGGDGTAEYEQVPESKVKMDVKDVAENLTRDQNGGRHIDTLPNEVKPKDGLSASDISTSVEEHTTEGSELETIEVSEVEHVDDADCLVMDMDDEPVEITGLTDVTEDALDNAADLAEKAAEVETAIASVERYIGLLQRMDDEGKLLSPELRQTIAWGLESIDAELFKQECVSLEANDLVAGSGIDDGEDPAVTKKGLSGKLKKLIETGVRLFHRLVNALGDIYNSIVSDSGKIRDHLSDLRGKVKALEGGTTFTMKNPHRLMVGDEFVGDSKAAIDHVAKVTTELLDEWPGKLRKIIDKATSSNSGKLAFVIDALGDAINGSFRTFKTLNPGDKDLVPSGFLDADKLTWSGVLPGNRAVYASVNKTKQGFVDNGPVKDVMAAQKVSVSFSAIPSESTHSNQQDVKTLSAAEATIIIRSLEKLLDVLDQSKREAAEFKSKASHYIDASMKDLFTLSGDGAGDTWAGLAILNAINATSESQRQYIGYVLALVKAYIGYMHASLKAEHGDVIDA